jgi:phosphohistidine phosphatase
MRRLILFRHAKTEAHRPGGDFERRLTNRGRRDALAMGQRLARAGLAPDLVLTSTARRATETWSCASPALPKARVEMLDALYNAAPGTILGEIERFENQGETLMAIGHNPGLQELAVFLVARAAGSASDIQRLASAFPTATAAVYAVDEAGRFALEDLLLPERR